MDVLLSGFCDEVCKLAADLTPSPPAMTDQKSFAGVSSQVNSSGIKKLLPTSIGALTPRMAAPPPRTTPPKMQQQAI